MKLEFDMKTTCQKCGGTAFRLKKSQTWHHLSDDDYRECGYVEIGKRYVNELKKKKRMLEVQKR